MPPLPDNDPDRQPAAVPAPDFAQPSMPEPPTPVSPPAALSSSPGPTAVAGSFPEITEPTFSSEAHEPSPASSPTTAPQPTIIAPLTTSNIVVPPVTSAPIVNSFGATTVPANGSGHATLGARPKARGRKKWLVIVLLVLIILGGGSAGAYFGYYLNPSVIWKQALDNTNRGYSQLVSYIDTQTNTHYKSFALDGSFKATTGGTNYDGSISAKTDGKSSTESLKLDLGVANLDVEERSLVPAGSTAPDVYLQASGIKGLSGLVGTDLGPQVDSLDGQWIVIDHNLLEDLQNKLRQQSGIATQPKATLTWSDVKTLLQAIGKTDQQYVFTTNKAMAVTTVVKHYGLETVDSHRTYHYKVGFVKANVKTYIAALCDTYSQSAVAAYINKESGQPAMSAAECQGAAASASDGIKSSDTIDVWAEVSHRMIYKVRVSDPASPAENFVDIGLNYKNSGSYPFFVNFQSKSGTTTDTASLVATLNTKTNAISLNVTAASKGGDTPTTFSGNFNLAPSNAAVNVTAPTGVKSLTGVLNEFGLGGLLSNPQDLTSLGTSSPLTQTF